MKKILLTQGCHTLVDDEDADLAPLHWYATRDASSVTFYAKRNVRREGLWTTELLHKCIAERMGIVGQVDHRDRNGLNNRRLNLRTATAVQQAANHGLQRNNTSGYKGVTLHKPSGRWQARIKVERKMRALGYFADPADAALAYDLAAMRYHGDFAVLNFPLDSLFGQL
jgi:hypothetical protein